MALIINKSVYKPVTNEKLGTKLPDDERIIDSDGKLTIELLDVDGRRSNIIFQSYYSFRKIPEGESYETLAYIELGSGNGYLLYTVENSEFIEWYQKENRDMRDINNTKHFCITTYTSIIDVLTIEEPIFNWPAP